MNRYKGFTLIELMVTIVVLAIIATIAIPNLANLIDSNRARSQVNTYRDMLTLARAEAINRGTLVRVSRLGDGQWAVGTAPTMSSCSSNGVIRCFPAPASGASVTVSNFPAGGLVFTSQGYVRGMGLNAPAPTVTVTFENQCQHNRIITVSPLGRIRSEKGACS